MAQSIHNPFISFEYEHPSEDGTYEVLTLYGVVEAEYDSELDIFVSLPNFAASEPPWRHSVPNAKDMEEYRLRGRDGIIWI